MKYHESPSNYNWDGMPNTFGTMETAKLMRDIGSAVNMQYSCGSSGAHMRDVPRAFNQLGYQNVRYSGFNRETVKQQLRWNKPVILSGYKYKKKKCFLWWCSTSYKEGHAWVCDGYRTSTIYSEDCRYAWGYLYLHMNWGWTSNRLNGWFSYNNWNPGNTSFNHKKEMIYNINP